MTHAPYQRSPRAEWQMNMPMIALVLFSAMLPVAALDNDGNPVSCQECIDSEDGISWTSLENKYCCYVSAASRCRLPHPHPR